MNEATNHDSNPPASTDLVIASQRSRTERQSKQRLNAFTEYLARVASASLLTMWGALNLMVNARVWLAMTPAESPAAANSDPVAWWIPVILVALTSLVPLLIGLRMFYGLLRQTKSDEHRSER